MPALAEQSVQGLTLLVPAEAEAGAACAFTERTGGVSKPPFDSLNLGSRCGDDPESVAENRRRVLAAIGAEGLEDRLVSPHQVHGDRLVVVADGSGEGVAAAQSEAAAGADGVVCTAGGVPVLLCFADCVPVVVTAPGGFAVAHSGWKGTMAHIAAKAARLLMEKTGANAGQLAAYVGPHVGAADYEVSPELAERFRSEFGEGAVPSERHVDLGACVVRALEEAGMARSQVAVYEGSTASEQGRFFSYRASGGSCGRHGAIAMLRGQGGAN